MGSVNDLRVLVVEDHPDIYTLYTRLLPGASLSHACNGQLAREALEKETYDLIILDMHLGEVSGIDVLRHARSLPQHRATRILVISADDSLRHEAMAQGADHWINKPIDFDSLFDYLEKAASRTT
jgi:CheY-like chemotaxis protein